MTQNSISIGKRKLGLNKGTEEHRNTNSRKGKTVQNIQQIPSLVLGMRLVIFFMFSFKNNSFHMNLKFCGQGLFDSCMHVIVIKFGTDVQ